MTQLPASGWGSRRRVLPLAGALALLALSTVALRFPDHASGAPMRRAADAAPGAIWQLTYLKAHPGASVDSLARVVTANWFAMDAQAVKAGDLAGYHLVRGSAADTTWDLLEIAVFRDSAQHARADSLYRTRYRPAHRPVRVGGRDLAGWGRIVRSEPLRYVAGGP